MPSTPQISVLLVEDNVSLRDELSDFLRLEDFEVRVAGSGQEMNLAVELNMPDILVVDLNLPDEDGIQITKRIRSSLPNIGIIILTARVRSTDRKEGYESGADVYLTKPTNPIEIVSVIRNLHARLKPVTIETQWELDTAENMLYSPDHSSVKITSSETMLLKEIILNGNYVSHEDLIENIGMPDKNDDINKARIEVLISRLRKKISVIINPNLFIQVIRGRGYQLKTPISLKNLRPTKNKLN
ncbi:MAG: DNA-binding response regulator [Betaproteobacteria bacterium]|nr:DNA-binding response regulator [Betaproteobacteria bacterium]